MTKKMLINATHPEENRVAIVEDGILTELDIEIAGKEQTKGNVYKASVVRVEPGLQAAFIDYGAERFGFLQMGEIHPSYFPKNDNGGDNRRPRISDVLRRGQELLVQVVKEERGTKGAALTTFLSLPGRYMVLMPESDTKGVSRKIEDESQRKKLKEAMASLDLPAHMGYIVRTAGIGQKKEELKRDFDYLVRVYRTIQEQAAQTRAPALIYKESNLAIRSLRDYFSSDMDEVLVDDPRVAEEAREFFQQVMPEYARLVKLHQERRPIFSRYQIEEQIDTISKNKVQLPSGGSIVIDPTEALVSVDVNSGKMAGEQGVESTAYKTNLEAAAEIARQLRLRDLGGLIVIDFIDMRDRKHIRDIEKCLKDSLKYDKARVTVGRISQFGLLEMSRQRIKAVLAEGSFLPCPHCDGSGKVKSAEAQAIAFLRKVHSAVAKGQIGRVEGEVPLDVATYLLNIKREELFEMERRHQMVLVIKGRPDFIAGQSTISVLKRERDEQIPEPPERSLVAPTPFTPVLVPAPATTEESAVEEGAEAIPEGQEALGEEGAKKKRKRRRKKKKPGEPEAPQEEGVEEPLEEEVPLPEEEAEGDESEEEEFAETAELSDTAAGTEERRKKRRRRRRKKTGAAAAAASAAEGMESGTETPEEAEAIPALTQTAPEPEHKQGAEPGTPLPSEDLVTPQGEERSDDPAAAASAPAAKPPRSRRRPPARKKGEAPATQKSEEKEGSPPSEAPQAQENRRGEAPTESHLSTTAAGTPSQEGPPALAQETGEPQSEKAPAPARKKRPTRKKAEPKTAADEKDGTAEGSEKPKRPARPRKAAKSEGEQTTASSQEEGDVPQKKPRRTTRKKVEEPTESE